MALRARVSPPHAFLGQPRPGRELFPIRCLYRPRWYPTLGASARGGAPAETEAWDR